MANDIHKLVTHTLVFLFQLLADNYTQSLAIFALKGLVVGIELAKLLVKCIVCLEESEAIVHGFVSDSAQTNYKMWSELGINSQQDTFQNLIILPLDNERKVYAFSKTPRLIKNVRNWLYNQKVLKVTLDFI